MRRQTKQALLVGMNIFRFCGVTKKGDSSLSRLNCSDERRQQIAIAIYFWNKVPRFRLIRHCIFKLNIRATIVPAASRALGDIHKQKII